jgi:hypothetical protein
MSDRDQSFEFFLLYLEQVFSHEISCLDECHRRVQCLLKECPDQIEVLYLDYLFQCILTK